MTTTSSHPVAISGRPSRPARHRRWWSSRSPAVCVVTTVSLTDEITAFGGGNLGTGVVEAAGAVDAEVQVGPGALLDPLHAGAAAHVHPRH